MSQLLLRLLAGVLAVVCISSNEQPSELYLDNRALPEGERVALVVSGLVWNPTLQLL
jgi:hypothetical protein